MDKLKKYTFTANRIENNQTVKGTIELVDFEGNQGGYSVAINTGKETHVVNPDTVELVLKPHPDYDFEDDDRLFIENSDGSSDYYQLHYDKEGAEWVLIPFINKHFKKVKKKATAEPLQAFGYDLLNRVEDYDFEELT